MPSDSTAAAISEPSVSIQVERHQLAAAFRLAEKFGLHEGICNHFSLRVDGEQEHYLINPYGTHWSQIQADTLLLIDADGQILEGSGFVEDSARFIHVAGHRANPRHKVLLHTHMPYATSMTMLNNESARLPMTHQTAIRFYGRTAYVQEFGGLALDENEGQRLAEAAETEPQVDITFLAHHGVVVGGSSVALAFDDLYYLERACRQYVFALHTGVALKNIPENTVLQTWQQFAETQSTYAESHFNALCKVLESNPNHHFTF